ncbi:hypothetical protein R6Q59_023337, partial [Mikania micrantha]
MSFWDVNFYFGDDKIEQDSVGRSYHDKEEINVEEQLQAVKQQIMTQQTEVKK